MNRQYKIGRECVKIYTYPLIFFQVKQSFHLIENQQDPEILLEHRLASSAHCLRGGYLKEKRINLNNILCHFHWLKTAEKVHETFISFNNNKNYKYIKFK